MASPSPSRAEKPEADSLVAFPDRDADHKPKLLVALGRGGTGKSVFVRTVVERAHNAGRELAIADADRTNATLQNFFADVIRPDYQDEKTVHDWLDEVINQQVEKKLTVVLDMGGGDQVFKGFARELELASAMTATGIIPVAVHLIGPDLDDLAYLRDIEESNSFCPAATALVLNEGLIRDNRPREAAFDAVRSDPIYRKALKRGAREVWFPKLGCMQEVNSRHLLFAAAEQGALGFTNRLRVGVWRRQVEEALLPISDWLP